eukprot:scaffold58394_cov88-Phaeocystis_antarctica.AAC.2
MTSTIKRRPRGYRTGISSEVFEFVMKLLRETLGTTGRYLDLMRSNAPLRIQGPAYKQPRYWLALGPSAYMPRQFYRWPEGYDGIGPSGHTPSNRHVHNLEYRQATKVRAATGLPVNFGSLVPFRNTYNASRII